MPANQQRELKPLGPPLGPRILMALFCAGVLWLWYAVIRFRPDDVRDYVTITGTLVSTEAEVKKSRRHRSGYFEILLRESPLRYCVEASEYLDNFRGEAFYAEVSKGDTVELSAHAAEMAAPRMGMLKSRPTVYIAGVRAHGRDYLVVQDHIAGQWREFWTTLAFALGGSAIVVFIVVSKRRREKEEKAREMRRADETPRRTRRSPHY